ncbi:MAG: hypothetical protein JXA73_08170 [Acidobacteria bacterium]|nr:hypothetical protein [Acidobacteriota bacterium]
MRKKRAAAQGLSQLKYDPIKPLLASENAAIIYFAQRDLLDRDVGSIEAVWNLPQVVKIIKKQQPDGSWKSNKHKAGAEWKTELTETWRQLRFLVDQYELDRTHIAIQKAAEFVFSCQSDEGDFRGILANQYAPYYTGALLWLLIKAGYQSDLRIEKGMQWLISMRQNDGGWVIGSPGMVDYGWGKICSLTSTWTAEPEKSFNRSRPFSAAGTGMVIRAFAVHPVYRNSEPALKAAALLKSKFFKKDNWSWYRHPDHWIRFEYPYWWNNLLSAIDTLSLIGLPSEDDDIRRALQWFIDNQQRDGLWKVSYSSIHKATDKDQALEIRQWITLAISRIFKHIS